jgi:hypothetical protein
LSNGENGYRTASFLQINKLSFGQKMPAPAPAHHYALAFHGYHDLKKANTLVGGADLEKARLICDLHLPADHSSLSARHQIPLHAADHKLVLLFPDPRALTNPWL